MRGRRWLSAGFVTALVLVLLISAAAGCGGGSGDEAAEDPRFLESERRLEGMYEGCRTIDVIDPLGEYAPIETDDIKEMETVDVETVLVRSNGMEKPGVWTGVQLSSVLEAHGIQVPFEEIRMEAWDGYVAKISYDIAMRPDTIIAWLEDGKPIPEEEGPVRLVVGSEDGFYWIHRITSMEFTR